MQWFKRRGAEALKNKGSRIYLGGHSPEAD